MAPVPLIIMLACWAVAAAVWTQPASYRPARQRPVQRPAVTCCAAEDPLLLEEIRDVLRREIKAEDTPTSSQIVELHTSKIEPLCPAIWAPKHPDREGAIQNLSLALDTLEVAAQGPLLSGRDFSPSDAEVFPTFCLLSSTLPLHFGWEEYTTEALFWKRPRLHGGPAPRTPTRSPPAHRPTVPPLAAWFELCNYEKPCREASDRIEAALQSIDWSGIAIDVPTNGLRRPIARPE